MRFHEATAVIEEAQRVSEAAFAAAHPVVSFIVEPFASQPDLSVVASAPPSNELPRSARVLWCDRPDLTLVRLGRDGDAVEIHLPHPRISKVHLTFERGANGWTVRDEGSSNGSALGQRVLDSGVPAAVADDDRVTIAATLIVRPFFSAARLHQVLRTATVLDSGSFRRSSPFKLELFEGLASTFRSLGLDVKLNEPRRELLLETIDGASTIRVLQETGFFAVEWGRGGVFLQRKTVPATDPSAAETLRKMIVELMRADSRPRAQTRRFKLEETQSD